MNTRTHEETIEGLKKTHTIKELGLTFQRFASPKCVRYVAYFQPVPKRGCGKPDKNSAHVYSLAIERETSICPSPWLATAYVDDATSFALTARGRCKCERLALSAFKGYLMRALRKSRRNLAIERNQSCQSC